MLPAAVDGSETVRVTRIPHGDSTSDAHPRPATTSAPLRVFLIRWLCFHADLFFLSLSLCVFSCPLPTVPFRRFRSFRRRLKGTSDRDTVRERKEKKSKEVKKACTITVRRGDERSQVNGIIYTIISRGTRL